MLITEHIIASAAKTFSNEAIKETWNKFPFNKVYV